MDKIEMRDWYEVYVSFLQYARGIDNLELCPQ